MKNRVRSFVFAIVLFVPAVLSAGQGDMDPNGQPLNAMTMADWFDAAVQVMVVYLGL